MNDFQNAKTEETFEDADRPCNQGEPGKGQNTKQILRGQETLDKEEKATLNFKESATEESQPQGYGGSIDIRGSETEEMVGNKQCEMEFQGYTSGPSADLSKNKTVDDLEGAVSNLRVVETVEDDVGQGARQAVANTRVIWKVHAVRPHQKNSPALTIIKSLPSAVITNELGKWVLLGRGETVDVYFHDVTSSRFHANFTVTRDRNSQRFVAKIMNRSASKKVIINGKTELKTNEVYELNQNDLVSIGVFTFLLEIVPGNNQSRNYALEFIDITGESMQIPSKHSSIQPLFDDVRMPVRMPGFPHHPMLPPDGYGRASASLPLDPYHFHRESNNLHLHESWTMAHVQPERREARLPSSNTRSRPHQQPVENTEDHSSNAHRPEENDETDFNSTKDASASCGKI